MSVIAVDGPAASGKGTLAVGLARHFNLPHLDTGLLYRAVGRAVKAYDGLPDFEARAVEAARQLDAGGIDPEYLLTAEMGAIASKVAVFPGVRAALLEAQRSFARQPGGAVLDGRDIGTTIAPDANVKLFIEADATIRAARRAAQLEARGQRVDRAEMLAQIEERDARDRNAPHGGFRPAADAVLLDTSRLDIDGALKAAIAIVADAIARRPAP